MIKNVLIFVIIQGTWQNFLDPLFSLKIVVLLVETMEKAQSMEVNGE